MTNKKSTAFLVALILLTMSLSLGAENKKEYQNRARLMLDVAVRLNDYVKKHLGDKGVCSYAQSIAEQNVEEASKMTPPPSFTMVHPHLLLVLENMERSFYFASRGELAGYRKFQKRLRKEMKLLDNVADREKLDLYYSWGRY